MQDGDPQSLAGQSAGKNAVLKEHQPRNPSQWGNNSKKVWGGRGAHGGCEQGFRG